MNKYRSGKKIFVVGASNTGKSSEVCFFVEEFNKKRDNDKKTSKMDGFMKLAVLDPHNRFESYMREGDFYIDVSNDNWIDEIRNLKESLIILDDHRQLLDSNTIPKEFLKFLFDCAEFGNDFIGITHSFGLIQPRLFNYIEQYMLFYNIGMESDYDRTLNPDLFKDCTDIINEHYKKFDKDSYKEFYPDRFPYIYIDTEKNDVKTINFEI